MDRAGVHPELNAYVEMLQHKRERRLEQARKRFDAREQALARRKTASEAAIWTMWNEAKVGSRNAMVAQTHREIRQLEREKGQPEILRSSPLLPTGEMIADERSGFSVRRVTAGAEGDLARRAVGVVGREEAADGRGARGGGGRRPGRRTPVRSRRAGRRRSEQLDGGGPGHGPAQDGGQ